MLSDYLRRFSRGASRLPLKCENAETPSQEPCQSTASPPQPPKCYFGSPGHPTAAASPPPSCSWPPNTSSSFYSTDSTSGSERPPDPARFYPGTTVEAPPWIQQPRPSLQAIGNIPRSPDTFPGGTNVIYAGAGSTRPRPTPETPAISFVDGSYTIRAPETGLVSDRAQKCDPSVCSTCGSITIAELGAVQVDRTASSPQGNQGDRKPEEPKERDSEMTEEYIPAGQLRTEPEREKNKFGGEFRAGLAQRPTESRDAVLRGQPVQQAPSAKASDLLPEEYQEGFGSEQLGTEPISKQPENPKRFVHAPKPLTLDEQLTNEPAKIVSAVQLGSDTVRLADFFLTTNRIATEVQRDEPVPSMSLSKESSSSSSDKKEVEDFSAKASPPKSNVIDTFLGILKINPAKNITNKEAENLISQDAAPQSQEQKDPNVQEPNRPTLAEEPKPTREEEKMRARDEGSLQHPWPPSDQWDPEPPLQEIPQENAEHMIPKHSRQKGKRPHRKPKVQTDKSDIMPNQQKTVQEYKIAAANTPEVHVAHDFSNEIQNMKERTVKDYIDILKNPFSDPEAMRESFEKIEFQHKTVEDYKFMVANTPEIYVVQDFVREIQNMKEGTVKDYKALVENPFWGPETVRENFEKIEIQHLKDNTVRDYKDMVHSPFWDPTAMKEELKRNPGTSKGAVQVEELMTGMLAIKAEVLEHNERLLQETASIKAELKSEITALKDTIKATDKIAEVKKDLVKEIAAVKDVAMQTLALEAKKSVKEIAAIKDEIILKIGAMDKAKQPNRAKDSSVGERPTLEMDLRDQKDKTLTIAKNPVKEIASQEELGKEISGFKTAERVNQEVLRVNELVTTMQGKVVTSLEKSGKEMETMKEALLKEILAVKDKTAKNAEMLEKPIKSIATMQNALMKDVAVVKDKTFQNTKLAEKPAKEIATMKDELMKEIAAIKDSTHRYFAKAAENPANEIPSLKQELPKEISAKASSVAVTAEKITKEVAAMKEELMREIASIKNTSASNCAEAAEKPVKEVAKIKEDFMKGIAEIKETNNKMAEKPVEEIAIMRDEILKLLQNYSVAKGGSAEQNKSVQKVKMTRENKTVEENFPSARTSQPLTELAPIAQELMNELESFKERTIQNALMASIRMKEIAAVKDLLSQRPSVVSETGTNKKTVQVFQQLAKDPAMRSEPKPACEDICSLRGQCELPNNPSCPQASTGGGSPKPKSDPELNQACLKQAAASGEAERNSETPSEHISRRAEPGTRRPYPTSKSPANSRNRPPPFFPTNQSPRKRLSTSTSGTSLPADITRAERGKASTRSRSLPPANPSAGRTGPLAGSVPSVYGRFPGGEGADDNLISVLKRGVIPIEQSKIREYFFPKASCTNTSSAGSDCLCPPTQPGSTASKPPSSDNPAKPPPEDTNKNPPSGKKPPKSSSPGLGGSSPFSIGSNSRGSPKSGTSGLSPTSCEHGSKARCSPRKTCSPTSQSFSILENKRAPASDGQCKTPNAGTPPGSGRPHNSSTAKGGGYPSILSTQSKPGSPSNPPSEPSNPGNKVPSPKPSDFGTPPSGTGSKSGVDKGTAANKGIPKEEKFPMSVQPTEWDEKGIAKVRYGLSEGPLLQQGVPSESNRSQNAASRTPTPQTDQVLWTSTNPKPSNENLVKRSDGTAEGRIEQSNHLEDARLAKETVFRGREDPKETYDNLASVSIQLERVDKPLTDQRGIPRPGGETDVNRIKRFDIPAKASRTLLGRYVPKEDPPDLETPAAGTDARPKSEPSEKTNLPAVSHSNLPERGISSEKSGAPVTTILLLSRAAESLRIKISKPNAVNRRRSGLISTSQSEDPTRIPEASENSSGPRNTIDITYHEVPALSKTDKAPKPWSENPQQRQNDILSKLASLPAIIREQEEARSTGESKQTHIANYERDAAKFLRECTLGKPSTTRTSTQSEDRNTKHIPSKRDRNTVPAGGLQLPAIVPETGLAGKILTKEQVAEHNQKINKLEKQKSFVREGLLQLKYVRERCSELPSSLKGQLRALLPDPEEMERAIAEILSYEKTSQRCPQKGSFSEEIERAITEILSYEGVSRPPKPKKLSSFREAARAIDEILSAEKRKTTPLKTQRMSSVSVAGIQVKPESKSPLEKLKTDSIKDSAVTENPEEFPSEVLLAERKASKEYRPRYSLGNQLTEQAPGQPTTQKPVLNTPSVIQIPPSTPTDRAKSQIRIYPPAGKPHPPHDFKGPGGANFTKTPGKSFHTAVSADGNFPPNSPQQTLGQDQNPQTQKNIECKSGPPGCPCVERGGSLEKGGGSSKDSDGSGHKATDGSLPAIVNDGLNKQVATEMGAFLGYFKLMAHFGRVDVAYRGIESFFRKQVEEEREHALEIASWTNIRGGENLMGPVGNDCAPPPVSPSTALTQAVAKEASVTKSLHKLRDTSERCGDVITSKYLSKLHLREQAESVNEISRLVTNAQRAESSPREMLTFDESLYEKYKSD